MTAAWWEGPFLAFDLETTDKDPENARIVTAACITVGAPGVLERRTWLVDPAVEIPAETTAIHGVTTEHARTNGMNAAQAVEQIADAVSSAWRVGTGLCAMNAAYDGTVIQRELARHGLPLLGVGPVLDPLVIDRAVDRYRKGSRKLDALARHYGVRLDGAHASDEDALTAVRIVWRQARHPRHGRVLRSMTLDEMQRWQAAAHCAWSAHYQDYLRTRGGKPDAVVDPSWPWRPPPTEERAAP